MKIMQPAIAFLMIVLATAVCCGGDGNNGGITPESEQPIGNIAPIRTRVEAGRYGNIKEVSSSRDFFDNESVRVRDSGKGKINFNDGSEITLYNNTSAERVVAQFSPPEISLLLTEQGFQGYVPKGNTLTVNMPNGAQVKILGTQFFVVFDQNTNYTTVGNFDGTVRFTPPGGFEQELGPATMVDIAPDGQMEFYELPYKPDTFDSAADGSGSPVGGLWGLRKEYGQPFPGENSPSEPPAKPVTIVIRYLVSRGKDFVPDLAESWSTDPDGYIIEFHLRSGILLADGTPFTSSYVRDQLETKWQYAMEGNVSFELLDDLTISFHLFSPAVGYVLEEMSIFEFEVQLGGPV
jgi:ABC-type transport system substrate-binding protein